MSEKLWWETHALLLGKLTADLLTLEIAARLMLAKQEAGGDLRMTKPNLALLREGDWVEVTPLSNNKDMTWALNNYNKCIKRKHPELMVDAKVIVCLRDALTHGRSAGFSKPQFAGPLSLLKFSKGEKNGKVQVTLRVDMTKEWFDAQSEILFQSISKVAKALDFDERELGTYYDAT